MFSLDVRGKCRCVGSARALDLGRSERERGTRNGEVVLMRIQSINRGLNIVHARCLIGLIDDLRVGISTSHIIAVQTQSYSLSKNLSALMSTKQLSLDLNEVYTFCLQTTGLSLGKFL